MEHHKYGDLERYLGAKYARDIAANPELLEVYEEADNILFNSMDAMSLMNKVSLNLHQWGLNRQAQQAS